MDVQRSLIWGAVGRTCFIRKRILEIIDWLFLIRGIVKRNDKRSPHGPLLASGSRFFEEDEFRKYRPGTGTRKEKPCRITKAPHDLYIESQARI